MYLQSQEASWPGSCAGCIVIQMTNVPSEVSCGLRPGTLGQAADKQAGAPSKGD